ncbi:MAG: two-component system sensor histidine kinase/response regulator [Gammaproteobacteria bacterium]|jgi:two-component system sensor histidine kinase/response regulator
MELGISEIRVDDVVQFFGITRDITERREAESALQQAKLNTEASSQSKIGFVAYFHKPTIAHDLYDALALFLSDLEPKSTEKPLLTRLYITALWDNTISATTQRQLAQCVNKRILLVEDNAINQVVALGMLKDLGLSVYVVGNGLEAIIALQESNETTPYPLVLMDCQMLIVDGYTATANICKGDAGARNSNIVIIAMTANVMRGDREKCIAAGMNDYLSKPIDEHPLMDCLVEWMSAPIISDETNDMVENTDTAAETGPLVWDEAALQARIRNRQDRVTKVIQLFLADMPERVGEFE